MGFALRTSDVPWLFLPRWFDGLLLRLSRLRALLFILALVALSSCAAWGRELRKGWVQVDYLSGGYTPEVVCELSVVDGDVLGRCMDLVDYLQAMDAAGMLERHRTGPVPKMKGGEL